MRKGDKMPRECSRKPVKMMMQSVLLKVKRENERERERERILSYVGEHGYYISGVGNTAE